MKRFCVCVCVCVCVCELVCALSVPLSLSLVLYWYIVYINCHSETCLLSPPLSSHFLNIDIHTDSSEKKGQSEEKSEWTNMYEHTYTPFEIQTTCKCKWSNSRSSDWETEWGRKSVIKLRLHHLKQINRTKRHKSFIVVKCLASLWITKSLTH